ncbi:MAG: MATE family efflux transporter [Oscillospiraceae bacterium]|nr:MATE family efflux transporter [Oscillospiraceae bacterium]
MTQKTLTETISSDKDSLLFTNKQLFGLTLPLILNSLLSMVIHLADSVMVSSAGEAAVGAVSLVSSITFIFIMLITAATSGGIILTSQYVGKGDIKSSCESAKQLTYLAFFAGIFIAVVLTFLRTPILKLAYSTIEPDVFENCRTYLLCLAWGYPFFAIGASCTAILRSIGKNALSVTLSIGMNVCNVIGNAILIFGFKMGVAGAALATAGSYVIFAATGLIVLHNKNLKVHFDNILNYKPNTEIIKKIVVVGGTAGIGDALFYVGKLLLSALLATFGTVAIASYSAAYDIANFGWTGVGGFTMALGPIVGQCIGAGKTEQAKLYLKKMTRAATVFVVVVFGLMFVFRNQIVRIYDFTPETLESAGFYMGVAALSAIFSVYSWAFLPVGAFRAAGEVAYSLALSVSTMFIFRVGLSYLLAKVFHMGIISIWIGMWADWACRSVINFIHFKRGKWVEKKLV